MDSNYSIGIYFNSNRINRDIDNIVDEKKVKNIIKGRL